MSMDKTNMEGGAEENATIYKDIMSEVSSAIPGIDEAASFSEVLGLIKSYNFDTVVFDTAPTGHTLRLLNLPNVIDKALIKIMELKDKFGGMLNTVASLVDPAASKDALDKIFTNLEKMKVNIENVNNQFKNSVYQINNRILQPS